MNCIDYQLCLWVLGGPGVPWDKRSCGVYSLPSYKMPSNGVFFCRYIPKKYLKPNSSLNFYVIITCFLFLAISVCVFMEWIMWGFFCLFGLQILPNGPSAHSWSDQKWSSWIVNLGVWMKITMCLLSTELGSVIGKQPRCFS